jgi:hypothetical protein
MDIKPSREVSRARLRDIVIGSAIAATLVAMMPANETGRNVVLASPSLPKARALRFLLPKPKPACAKAPHVQDVSKYCTTHASMYPLRTYSAYGETRIGDIKPGRHIDISI